ncbi:MAG TPA: cell division protein ZapA [Clostridia bacterium]|nr:cell division protein ZapA [Clostridia bacterium]
MGRKNKVIVRIGGREYAMRGSESEEYIHKVAIYVDKKMEEISAKQPPLSISMLAILTAINLADEVIKQKDEIQSLKRELNEVKSLLKMTEGDRKIAEGDRTNIYDMPKKMRR